MVVLPRCAQLPRITGFDLDKEGQIHYLFHPLFQGAGFKLQTMTAQNSPEATQYDRIIKPRSGLIGIDFRELWQFRELFLFLAWRDILLRYKQTYLGVLWAIL